MLLVLPITCLNGCHIINNEIICVKNGHCSILFFNHHIACHHLSILPYIFQSSKSCAITLYLSLYHYSHPPPSSHHSSQPIRSLFLVQAKQALKEAPKDDEEVDRKEEGEIDKGFTESSSSEDEELTEEGKIMNVVLLTF